MRNLTPERRRAATICAACGAIIPSSTLLMYGSHSSSMHFVGGLIVGVAFVVSIGTLVKFRRTCATTNS